MLIWEAKREARFLLEQRMEGRWEVPKDGALVNWYPVVVV